MHTNLEWIDQLLIAQKEHGHTQLQAARACGKGISTWKRWINGESSIDLIILQHYINLEIT